MILYSYRQNVGKAMIPISILISFWAIMAMVLIPGLGPSDALLYSGLMTLLFLLSMS